MTLVNWLIRGLSSLLVKKDIKQLDKIPDTGPLILAVNHVNFLDVPIVAAHSTPKPLTALVKVETWDSPLMGELFTLWDAIPIRRGEADLDAMRAAVKALENGRIVGMAPEGTRSEHGQLQQGLPGIALLAVRSNAPILPLVYYGHEVFKQNIRKLKRAPFHVVVGEPFRLNIKGQALSRDIRTQATNEIMYQMAALLPEKYRGIYADLSRATEEFLEFDAGHSSNLRLRENASASLKHSEKPIQK